MKIDVHIRQYPYEVSHYGRNRTKKRYLRPDLIVRKMYVMFVEKEFPEAYKQIAEDNLQPEKIDCVVRYEYYFRYFKENFNYGFGQPRTDVCGKCEEMKVKIRCEKNRDIRKRLQTELKLHKVKAEALYQHLRQCTEKAKQSEGHETICFDFEQNFPFPHLPVGEIFYKRQLWFYNFSVHSCKTGQPVMYTWPEPTARRGCREVISCLNHFIQTKVPHTVKHLDLFSDGCRGQNHNHTMLRYLFTLVDQNRFQSIIFHLPIRGHSFLPCDRQFAVIERMKRKKDTAEMYTDWHAMINAKYMTVEVTGHMIHDNKGHFDKLQKNSYQGQRKI